jgi:hypothetical protein
VHALNLWMSAGGTESVLHTDPFDNLNCVFAGSKRFFLIDAIFSSLVTSPKCGWYDAEKAATAAGDGRLPTDAKRLKHGYGAFGGYPGHLNVSAVDLLSFPCLANVPHYEATLQPGDCLFLPSHWFHHVASDGGPPPHTRSVAFNLWWKRPQRFDPTDCVERHPTTGEQLYGAGEPVPAADCAASYWSDQPPRPHEPACRPGRRGSVTETELDSKDEL